MFNYRMFSLFESVLKIDDNFYEIIRILKNNGDTVAKSLVSLFDKDIKTNLNYLKPTDINNQISFVNDTQVQRIIDKGENPFDKATNKTSVGRAVQQILKANGIDPTPQDIEKFTNNYKSMFDIVVLGKTPDDYIRIVEGEDIRYWYNENNYVTGGGTLNNSCMRYSKCQKYLDIYVENPEVCKLIILLSDDKTKLAARALLWKLDNGDFYLDRIYIRNDYQEKLMYNFFKKKYPNSQTHYDEEFDDLYVSLKNADFNYYPYMDSLRYLDIENKVLSSESFDDIYFSLRATDGSKEVENGYWSERLDTYISRNNAVDIGDNDWVPKEMCIWSEEIEEYIFKEDAVETEWGIYHRDNCDEIERNGEMVWAPTDKIIKVYKDNKIIKVIEDDYDTSDLEFVRYRESSYDSYNVYAQTKDIIEILPRGKFVFNDYVKSLILNFGDIPKNNNNIIEVKTINFNIDDILKNDEFTLAIGGNESYIPSDISDFYDFNYEKQKYRRFINIESYYDVLFDKEYLIVDDLIVNYRFSDTLKNKLFILNEYLMDKSYSYKRRVKMRGFNKSIYFKDVIYPLLKRSSVNEAINNLFTKLVDDKDELYDITMDYNSITGNSKSTEEVEKVIYEMYPYWAQLVIYIYLCYNLDIVDSLALNQKERRFLTKFTSSKYKIGYFLTDETRSFNRNNRKDLGILDFDIALEMVDMYVRKEGLY